MTMRSTAICLRLSNLDPAIDTDLEEVAIEGAEDEAAQGEEARTEALGEEVRTEALGEEVRTEALGEEARTGAQEEDQDQATDQEEDLATDTDQEEDQVTITTTCWPQSPWELDRPNS